MPKWCPWRTSTSTSPVTSARSRRQTTCSPRCIDNNLQNRKRTLNIDPRTIAWKRVMDMNDRALRDITIGLGGTGNGIPAQDGFNITPASEVMAILCLATDIEDLKKRLGEHLRWAALGPHTGVRPRPQRPRRHGHPAEAGHHAQPGADLGEQCRHPARRSFRQHRARA
jgi:hypothetical protein